MGILVGSDQVGTAGSYFKVARLLSSGWDGFQKSWHAGGAVEGENRDAVVPAVRSVEKFPAAMHPDFRSRILALET